MIADAEHVVATTTRASWTAPLGCHSPLECPPTLPPPPAQHGLKTRLKQLLSIPTASTALVLSFRLPPPPARPARRLAAVLPLLPPAPHRPKRLPRPPRLRLRLERSLWPSASASRRRRDRSEVPKLSSLFRREVLGCEVSERSAASAGAAAGPRSSSLAGRPRPVASGDTAAASLAQGGSGVLALSLPCALEA